MKVIQGKRSRRAKGKETKDEKIERWVRELKEDWEDTKPTHKAYTIAKEDLGLTSRKAQQIAHIFYIHERKPMSLPDLCVRLKMDETQLLNHFSEIL